MSDIAPHILFVLGGARSGKSRYAQARAEALGGDPTFIATAQAFDDEMTDRIMRHRADRGSQWRTVEAPLNVAEIIDIEAAPGKILLVDCLTLWASNMMLAERDAAIEIDRIVTSVKSASGSMILVANEVGLGIVPDNALARRFRDIAGTINQSIASVATEVQLLTAGLPLRLK